MRWHNDEKLASQVKDVDLFLGGDLFSFCSRGKELSQLFS